MYCNGEGDWFLHNSPDILFFKKFPRFPTLISLNTGNCRRMGPNLPTVWLSPLNFFPGLYFHRKRKTSKMGRNKTTRSLLKSGPITFPLPIQIASPLFAFTF